MQQYAGLAIHQMFGIIKRNIFIGLGSLAEKYLRSSDSSKSILCAAVVLGTLVASA
jgi:hypothetical protein